MYTVLVGRAGIGKGMAMSPSIAILKESGSANILSDRLTMEYILERLSKGFPSATGVNGTVNLVLDSSAVVISPELSILITASLATLPILCDLWDARPESFSYGTRHKGEYTIKDPCLTMLGASTPEWLVSSIPSNAIGGGFTRRVNFVFAKDRSQSLPWPSSNHSPKRTQLVEDLRTISQLRGEFHFAPAARPIFEELYQNSNPGDFDDEATAAYKTSEWAHATKMAIVLSAARGDSMTIEKEDLELARLMTDEIAKDVPLVFRAVGESDLVAAAERILRFVEDRGYVSFQEIMRVQWRHVSAEDAQRILLTFIQGGLMREHSKGGKTVYEVVPQNQQATKTGGTP